MSKRTQIRIAVLALCALLHSRTLFLHTGAEPVVIKASSDSVYYGGTYWNDFPMVRDELSRRATGRADLGWAMHLKGLRGSIFKRALIINCGNGWVERELWQQNVIQSALGLDIADGLLDQARTGAAAINASQWLVYQHHDANNDVIPPGPYDLVLNYAAVHHIAYIDKVFSQFRQVLSPDGWFVSYDYVGPHRNQYPSQMWRMIGAVNMLLPPALRYSMRYPHLKTMLHTDPSEAIHSELFNVTLRRHFEVIRWASVGGCIAYPIITHNEKFFSKRTVSEKLLLQYVDMLLRADWAYTETTGRTLFAYVIAKPKTQVDAFALQQARFEEEQREAEARQNDGLYYTTTFYQSQ